MAAKKKTSKGEKPMTKTAFIKTFADNTPADDIVAKGKEAGLELTKKFVWTIQSEVRGAAKSTGKKAAKAKAKSGKPTSVVKAAPKAEAPAPTKPAAKKPSARKTASAAAAPGTAANTAEQKMRGLIVELGTARADAIYRSVRDQLSMIVAQP